MGEEAGAEVLEVILEELVGVVADDFDLAASDPPTPPPTAAAVMMTRTTTVAIQNLLLRTPQMVLDAAGDAGTPAAGAADDLSTSSFSA